MVKKFASILGVIATLAVMAVPSRALADGPRFARERDRGEVHERFHDNGRHLGWYKRHRDHDADDYRRVCDEDGDDCRPNPYFNGRYRYPNQYRNPGYYHYSGLAPRCLQLINNRRWLTAELQAAQARGDKKAQKRILKAMRETNDQLAGLDQQSGTPQGLPYLAGGYQPNLGSGLTPLLQQLVGY